MTDDRACIPTIKDLFDFYQRWPDLRPRMVRLVASPRLDAKERTILSAMIDLVDRVGPSDLSQDD
ncbi:hypothetical protein [Microvirga sp. VF16]|uniref:hypothetical protein n=1 Tax=Microvirga sp. VF16 TaxID=2807101 RepID=UPI00193D4756|nr:hypothetical protein [Microvirga sp. VF16]QRM35428.1 hypothetical protein JO965_44585 [Microvirga sp. VF16]